VQPSGPLAALFGAPSCRGPAGNLAVSAGLAAGKLARKRRRRQADQQRRQQARALEEHAERAATLAGGPLAHTCACMPTQWEPLELTAVLLPCTAGSVRR